VKERGKECLADGHDGDTYEFQLYETAGSSLLAAKRAAQITTASAAIEVFMVTKMDAPIQ
jgi:hypothetical protein